MKRTTQNHYQLRIARVMDYIHQNLDGDLDVNTLADIAAMSPYHFHRIYREMVQETVNGTVRRFRLNRAAADLIRTTKSLSVIAQQASYSSNEAFNRAFTQYFHLSPGEYRDTKSTSDNITNTIETPLNLSTDTQRYRTMFTVEIIEFNTLTLAGYEHTGDYMEIGNQFEKLFIYGASQGLVNDNTRSIGLYYDDPKSVPTEQLRSMACIDIATDTIDDDSLKTITITSGKCATVLFKGPYAELEQPYDWLFGHWLPESGLEMADFPPFEEYLNNPKDTPPNELLTRIHCLLEE